MRIGLGALAGVQEVKLLRQRFSDKARIKTSGKRSSWFGVNPDEWAKGAQGCRRYNLTRKMSLYQTGEKSGLGGNSGLGNSN